MNSKIENSWIPREYANVYNDSKKRGLRCFFSDEIDLNTKEQVKKFINYLRKKYFFPIRCNIYFTNHIKYINGNKEKCNGVFFEGDTNKTPSIYIPCKITKKYSIENIYLGIAYLLTYYFQWYFYEDDKRTNRSLKIEATKHANYIVWNYLNI